VGYAEAAVDEARREVLLNYVKGPFRGVVKNYVAGGVLVSDWDITINALFIPLKPWISSHFRKGAERALERLTSPWRPPPQHLPLWGAVSRLGETI
jgi:hypothetical protein